MQRIIIINKDIKYQCSVFIVPGNGPVLIGMPDCWQLQLLSINIQTTSDYCKCQINEQTRQEKNTKIVYILTTELNRKANTLLQIQEQKPTD